MVLRFSLMVNPLGPPIAGKTRPDGYLELFFPEAHLTVAALVEDVDGRPEIVGIEVKPLATGPRQAIRSDDLRRLPLRQLRDEYLKTVARGELTFEAFHSPPRRGPQPPSDDLLRDVADTYEQALAAGIPVLQAIQSRHHVSRAGASKYIRRAREAGHLGWPAQKGAPGATAEASPFTEPKSAKTTGRAAK